MNILIRTIVSIAGDRQGHQDRELNTDRLTIGRGTDQDLLLPAERVAFRHAEISFTDTGAELKAFAATGVTVNGQHCTRAFLTEGDQILLGGYRLVVIAPPTDAVDFALTVEHLDKYREQALDEKRFNTGPEDLHWLRKRRWAWGAFLLVLMLALGFPGWVAWQASERDSFRAGAVLPDDHFWLSGELSRAHRFVAHECEQCHQQPFERVPNRACENCHQDMGRHVAKAENHPDATGDRCADCHREHNGREGVLLDDQVFCTGCHENIAAVVDDTHLKDVGDFSDAHPDFRIRLLRSQDSDGVTEWHRTERLEMEPSLREHSGLIFDHEVHLAEEGVENETGAEEVMVCADCHRPDTGGLGMQSIRMERDCVRCHSLAFDPDMPERTVPHGEPEAVEQRLREYFSQRFIDNRPGDYPVDLGRPGAPPAVDVLQAEGTAWVDKRTRETTRDVFERRVCDTCHEVEQTGSANDPQWSVAPVRLNDSYWMDSARFDHGKHRNTECATCHEADQSDDAGDILMPDIDTCRECHGGQDAKQGLDSTCITCHRFHYQSHGRLEMP